MTGKENRQEMEAAAEELLALVTRLEAHAGALERAADTVSHPKAKNRLLEMRRRLIQVVTALEDQSLAQIIEVKDMFLAVEKMEQGDFV